MTNITLNLPQQFRIRPTIPFLFTDADAAVYKHLSMVGESYYTFYKDDYSGSYMVIIYDKLKGFISEEDLIDGIIKGKLVIV